MTLVEPIAKHCAIQFCRNYSEKNSIYLENPVVKEAKFGQFNILVRASDSADIGRLQEKSFLELLSSLVESA